MSHRRADLTRSAGFCFAAVFFRADGHRGRAPFLRDVRPGQARHADETGPSPWNRTAGIDDPEQRYLFIECRVENGIVLGPDGRPSQLTPFDEGYIDFLGRPWAQNWEKFFEQGWERPLPLE